MRNPSPDQVIPPIPTIPNHAQTAPIVYPVAANFNLWYNQGGATLTDHGESITLDVPSSGATNSLRCVGQVAPAAPYTVVAKLLPGSQMKQFHSAGIALLDNATQRVLHFAIGSLGSYSVGQWTNPTTFNATVGTVDAFRGDMNWMKVEDDNVDLIFSLSREGLFWFEVYRQARTAWLASPDRITIANQAYNAAAPQANVWATLQSWDVQ